MKRVTYLNNNLDNQIDAIKQKPVFEDIYQNYYFKIYRYILQKMRNQQDAEDLTATAFLYAYEHYDSFDPSKSAVSTWLFLIVNSRLKNYYRDTRTDTDISELEDYLFEENFEMDKAIYLTQLREAVAAALDNLPEKQREIVIQRYFNNKPFDEIAQKIGTTSGNVRVILSRTLDKLQPVLKEFE